MIVTLIVKRVMAMSKLDLKKELKELYSHQHNASH